MLRSNVFYYLRTRELQFIKNIFPFLNRLNLPSKASGQLKKPRAGNLCKEAAR